MLFGLRFFKLHKPYCGTYTKFCNVGRYYRARADAGKPGTGLGLSITKAIFDANGFPFGVQSAPGEGATFWFEAKLV